jgi:hypothetical protein
VTATVNDPNGATTATTRAPTHADQSLGEAPFAAEAPTRGSNIALLQ